MPFFSISGCRFGVEGLWIDHSLHRRVWGRKQRLHIAHYTMHSFTLYSASKLWDKRNISPNGFEWKMVCLGHIPIKLSRCCFFPTYNFFFLTLNNKHITFTIKPITGSRHHQGVSPQAWEDDFWAWCPDWLPHQERFIHGDGIGQT